MLSIGICSLLLLIRCFFSFSWSDESFYLTVVHRFWLGERIFADEWYTTQLSTPLLLPFYALYQWFTGGNEGVYLYFRLLYWLISSATAFFTYIKLRKWNQPLTAVFCALMYLFYSRANIGGMSYYNMTLTFVLLATLLIYEQLMEKRAKGIELFGVGVLLALAVVNTPFLAIPYFIIVGILLICRKSRCWWKEIFKVIAGTSGTAVVYLIYVLNKVSIAEILLNIPYILNEPELQKTNPVLAIPMMFARIVWRYKWTILPYIFLFLYICYKRWNKQELTKKENKWFWGINLGIFIVNYYLSSNMIGCINIALVLLGVMVLFYYNGNQEGKKIIFQTFGVSGASVVFGFAFSSDTGLDAMTIGFVLLAMGNLLLLFGNKNIQRNKLVYYVLTTVVIMVLVQSAFLRIGSVYRDAPLKKIDTQITSGPAKYLYTTAEHKEQYRNLQNDIIKYVREDDKVFYSKNCFWGYLCTENEYGVPSSWRMSFNSPRLEEYYVLNPDKIPTCIFVLKPEYGNFESSLIQNNEKADRPNENQIDGFLYNYILENKYEVIDTESSLVFRRMSN